VHSGIAQLMQHLSQEEYRSDLGWQLLTISMVVKDIDSCNMEKDVSSPLHRTLHPPAASV